MKNITINCKTFLNYYVDELGNVYNSNGYKMKQQLTFDGYYRITLYGKSYRVNRIVAETFIPNENRFPIVHHINNNRKDNSVINLEWCDNSNNQLQRFKTQKGTKCKKVVQMINSMVVATFDSPIFAEKETGICRQNIAKVCRGERKTAGGYVWKYV